MDDPCQYDLEYIQHYMQTREMGPEGIHGLDCYTYGWIGHPDKYAPDLRAITPKLNVDAFSKWFIHKVMDKFLGSRFHRQRKPSKVTGDIVYEQKNLLKITHFITCLVAAIPPMVATIALSYTSSFRIKLIVMAILNFLLVLFLSVFTKASRAEVFAAIAA